MKKLLSILALVLFFAGIANAAQPDWNPTVSADAKFKCKVILPLTWNDPTDVELGTLVDNTIKTFDVPKPKVDFILTGEDGVPTDYNVYISTTSPADQDGVVLNGAWTGDGASVALTGGTTTVTYTVNSVDATNATSLGDKVFTVGVSAYYLGL